MRTVPNLRTVPTERPIRLARMRRRTAIEAMRAYIAGAVWRPSLEDR